MPDLITKPGIYFGLDEDIYHSSPWCGSTDIKNLFSNPPDFWVDSWMNPDREPEGIPTPAQRYGRAIHSCILYGREVFDRTHRSCGPEDPEAKDYEGGETVSAAGVKLWLKEHGTQPLALKDENLELVKREFGVELLTPASYKRIVMAHASILANPSLKSAFSQGWPEVSIFWEQEGVPCKCRIDYLKARASVDLKSFTRQKRALPLEIILRNQITYYRYDMQLAHYHNGRLAAAALLEQGLIYGAVRPSFDWLQPVLHCDDPAWFWVFFSKEGAPIAQGIQVRWKQALQMSGQASITRAYVAYLENLQHFGTEMWVNVSPPREFDDTELPAYLW